jgi:ribosomal protein L13E
MMDLQELPSTRRQTRRHGRVGSGGTLRELGEAYLGMLASARELSSKIEHQVVAAKAAGYSLGEVSDASGLTVSQIEYVLASVDFQRRSATN